MHPSKIPALITLALWATAYSQDKPAQEPPLPGLTLAPIISPEEFKKIDEKLDNLKKLEKSVDQIDKELTEALADLKAEKNL